MTAEITTAQKIAIALHDNDGNVSKAAEALGMSRTTFRRHRDANADLIAEFLNEIAESAEAAEEPAETVADEPADVEPVEIATAGDIANGHTYQYVDGDPAIRVCLTHNPELGLYGDEECGGEHLAPAPAKGHCDQPGDGPDGKCCGHEDCGGCNGDGHLDTAPPAPATLNPAKTAAAAASTGTAAKKRVVAEAIIAAAAQIAGDWDHDEITADEARTWISSWMNYLPGNVWDERLGERSGAGRRNAS